MAAEGEETDAVTVQYQRQVDCRIDRESLEPVSKLSEQDNETSELNKGQEVQGVIFVSNHDTPEMM